MTIKNGPGGVLILRQVTPPEYTSICMGITEVLSNSRNTKPRSCLSIKLGHYLALRLPAWANFIFCFCIRRVSIVSLSVTAMKDLEVSLF
jgi:hypothetical protein